MGNDVYNKRDEDPGDIKEIMLDVPSGRSSYAVPSCGGALGTVEKLFAVPWDAFVLDIKNKRFTFDVPKDHLKNAPGCDKDNWHNMSNHTWAKGVRACYGTTPHEAVRL